MIEGHKLSLSNDKLFLVGDNILTSIWVQRRCASCGEPFCFPWTREPQDLSLAWSLELRCVECRIVKERQGKV